MPLSILVMPLGRRQVNMLRKQIVKVFQPSLYRRSGLPWHDLWRLSLSLAPFGVLHGLRCLPASTSCVFYGQSSTGFATPVNQRQVAFKGVRRKSACRRCAPSRPLILAPVLPLAIGSAIFRFFVRLGLATGQKKLQIPGSRSHRTRPAREAGITGS
jgi:hypothetical protein